MERINCPNCGQPVSPPGGQRAGALSCPFCRQAVLSNSAAATFDWRQGQGFFLLAIGRKDSGPVGIARRVYDMLIAWGDSGELPIPSAILAGQDSPGAATVLFVSDSSAKARAVMDRGLLRTLQSVAPVRLEAAGPARLGEWDRTTRKGILEPRFFPPDLNIATAAPAVAPALPMPAVMSPPAAPPAPVQPPGAAVATGPAATMDSEATMDPAPATTHAPANTLPPDDASPEALPPAPLPHDEPPATEERPAAAASAPRPLTIKTVDTPRNPASPPRVAAVSPAAMAVRAGDSSHRRSQSKRLRKKAKPGKKSKSPKDKPATPAAARKPRQPQRSRAGQRPASPPRRRNWRAVAIFVVTFVLVAAPAAAAVWLAYAPPFKASAMLRVVVLPSHLARAQPNEAQRRVVIKLEQWLLDSPTVLTRVLENPLVRRSAWFSPPAAPWPQSLLVHDPKPEDRLRTGLDLIIGPQSETVELSLRSAQGEDLSQVLDCVIAAYRAAAAERLDPQVESAYQKRYERFGELQRAILDQQDVVSALAADLDGADSETYLATCKLRLDQTQDQLSTVVRDLAVDLFQRGDVPARDGGAVSKLQERQKRLQEELSARQAQWEKASRLNSACTAARRELAQKQQDLDQVRAELNDLAMKRAVVAGDLEPIAAGPTGPAVRLADQRPWLLILVAALALAAGRVAIWLLGGSGAVAARAIEVAWPGQTRILAVLPDLAGARDKAPFDATAALRAALRAQRGPSHNALVQLTASTDPQAKSALATALARHLARQERVLLVDADMHEGSIAERLGLHVRWGLADILAARCTDAEAIIQAGDLHILPAGKLHAGAAIADLLAGPAMAQCLARWRAAWDLVLLDSPPVLGLSDAGILSHLVDRTLLVVSRGGCRLRDVRQALGHLRPGADGCVEVVFIGGGSSAKSKV